MAVEPGTLAAWLAHIERLHHRPVDLGLDRVRAVARRMGLTLPGIKIVVAGTNGKGSTCAMLDAILRAAGYRVGRYGSPHLLRFNERAQIDGVVADDAALLPHLAAVERARDTVSLTYFEFTTLAILAWFAQQRADVSVLEIGLGGRLDAVNIIDGDCALVTTVDLDHTELLGPTRERIAWEKAHVFRRGRPALCVDPDPPAALAAHARAVGADFWRLGEDFHVEVAAEASIARQWTYRGRSADRVALPLPALRGPHQLRNAAGVLAALEALGDRLPVDQGAVRRGLSSVQLAGRFQVIPGRPMLILDVAHNPHAARALAAALAQQAVSVAPDPSVPRARTYAIFGMLRDKDASAVVRELHATVEHWLLVPSAGERGLAAQDLARAAFTAQDAKRCTCHGSVAQALESVLAPGGGAAQPDDRIVVFGSFVIVAEALRWLERASR